MKFFDGLNPTLQTIYGPNSSPVEGETLGYTYKTSSIDHTNRTLIGELDSVFRAENVNGNSYTTDWISKDDWSGFNSDEERGNPSSRTIIEKLAKNISVGLIIEPARADGSIVSSRKGSVIGKLEIRGIAAHSGVEPEKGASAIYEITRKITEIAKLKIQNGNVNVTGLMGGERPHIVAEKAECLIELRASEQSTLNKTNKRIKEIVTNKTFIPKTKSTYKIIGQRPAMELNQRTSALLKITEKIYKKARMKFSHTSTGGGSDGNYLSAMGIPVLDGLGPIGGNLHTELEYSKLESIPRRGAILGALILQISSSSEI